MFPLEGYKIWCSEPFEFFVRMFITLFFFIFQTLEEKKCGWRGEINWITCDSGASCLYSVLGLAISTSGASVDRDFFPRIWKVPTKFLKGFFHMHSKKNCAHWNEKVRNSLVREKEDYSHADQKFICYGKMLRSFMELAVLLPSREMILRGSWVRKSVELV